MGFSVFCSVSQLPHRKILNTHHSTFLMHSLTNSLFTFFSSLLQIIVEFSHNMYSHRNASLSPSAESLAHFLSPQDASTAAPMQYAAAPQPHHHQVALGEFDSEASSNNTYNSCSSGCTSYMGSPSSLASYETRRVQRSVSSHSLQKNSGGPHHPFSPLFAQLLDSQNGPVRRACSTGDLQVPSFFGSLIINTRLINYTNTYLHF